MTNRTEHKAAGEAHLSNNVAAVMSKVLNRMNARLLDLLRPYDINNQHFRILQVLYASEPMTIGELYRGLVITQPVLSRILIQMEQRELVQRVADEKDSRVRNVVLTEKGRQLYSEVWPPASEILKRFTSKFNDDDLEKLIRALNRMDDSDLYEPD